MSPLSFNPSHKKRRFILAEVDFIGLFQRRLANLFGQDVEFPEIETKKFKILPYYWKFDSVTHASKTKHHTKLMIKGCVGRLYIKGDLKNIWPLLVLCSELHTGGKLSYSHGYYKLLQNSPPFFTSKLKDQKDFMAYGKMIVSESDKLFEHGNEGNKKEEDVILISLWKQIKNGTYRFSPNQAFMIKNRNGGDRLIENLSLEDYIVQRFILNIISATLENAFEDNSLGYRKGRSVEVVFSRIEALLEEGYHHILESDVEDFFPSIDLQRLEKLLYFYFPEKDSALVHLIIEAMHQKFIIRNKLKDRERGLALGSPLSPILTNLYLDSFDERFLGDTSVLLRYSDDFIIMAKTGDDIEKAALRSQLALAELGLKPKASKTRITHYKDGFSFLGRFFSPDISATQEREITGSLKKTVYITEPFAFLGLSGEAMEIKKGNRVIQTFPLRRIQAIIAMERISLSANLIRKCVDFKIPITLTLESFIVRPTGMSPLPAI